MWEITCWRNKQGYLKLFLAIQIIKNKAFEPSGIPDISDVNEDEKQVDAEYYRKNKGANVYKNR